MNEYRIYYIGFNIETLTISEAEIKERIRKFFQETGLVIYNAKIHECTKGAQSPTDEEINNAKQNKVKFNRSELCEADVK